MSVPFPTIIQSSVTLRGSVREDFRGFAEHLATPKSGDPYPESARGRGRAVGMRFFAQTQGMADCGFGQWGIRFNGHKVSGGQTGFLLRSRGLAMNFDPIRSGLGSGTRASEQGLWPRCAGRRMTGLNRS